MYDKYINWRSNRFCLLLALLGAMALTACGGSGGSSNAGGSTNDDDDDDNGGSNTTIAQAIRNAPSMDGDAECGGNIGTFSGFTYDHDGLPGTAELNVCIISGRITENVTLSNTIVWTLSGLVAVGWGNLEVEESADVSLLKSNRVTLTIQAGTLLRSATQSALVITRGSRINATGTAADPIIMGSNNDDDFNDRAQWGGLVLQGFAINNLCTSDNSLPTNPVCNIPGEGNTGFFGGNNNSDNSGTLQYVVVAEAGFEVAPNDELNGISFQGVGNGTTVDYIQVHNNDDDGVEFFGGAVNAKHLVLTSNKDDEIDWDEGYLGNIQYAIVRKAIDGDVTADPRGIEADNAGTSNVALPIAKPSLSNLTLLGDDSGGATDSQDGAKLRAGTGALVFNSVFKDFNECIDLDTAETTTQATNGGLVMTNVFTDCATQFDGDAAGVLTGGNGHTITNGAVTVEAGYGITEGDGIALSAPAEAGGTTNFFDMTDYAGAVEPGTVAAAAWWADWTIPGSL